MHREGIIRVQEKAKMVMLLVYFITGNSRQFTLNAWYREIHGKS
jgi:hypothetical protein